MAYNLSTPPGQGLFALYVGDLHPTVTEIDLVTIFSTCRGFVSAFLCKNFITGASLCYGYVNFLTSPQAMMAMKTLNYTVIKGRRIRVLMSNRDPTITKKNIGNVFVKNLEGSVDSLMLHNKFSTYGSVLSCKVALTSDGTSKGYGYVQFESPDSADEAIREANGSFIQGKQICVENFVKRSERMSAATATFNNLFVKNLDLEVTPEMLREKFSEFGTISSLIIQQDWNGFSRGFGFVCFQNPVDAKQAMESLNGTIFASKTIYVGIALKKAERQQLLRAQFEERRKKYKGLNVYIKNINNDVNEDQLRDYFRECGTINSVKIMRDDKGVHRGFGFVCFSTREEANNAIQKLNGVLFHEKPLYVAMAQTKDERAIFLQAWRAANLRSPLTPEWRPPFGIQQSPGFPMVSQPFGIQQSPGFPMVPMTTTARQYRRR